MLKLPKYWRVWKRSIKDEVNKVLEGVKFTAADKTRFFEFDDGSSIQVQMCLVDQKVEKDASELRYGVTWYFTYEYKVMNVLVAQYLLWQSYQSDGTDCSNATSWDSGSGVYPFGVNKYGTIDKITQGPCVKAIGNGGITSFGNEFVTVTIQGYCYPDWEYNWCSIFVS